ncbi:prolyl hydroxylase family protein [Sphingomonas baiyangensis]|uniref:2OG-Fe(II) oxygenase n=1 Tax=Sphingomonas baiyangensis TaxID=2572576 RepID=A0A4U1L372_9SPHN|nr:2OG-Fe(II) oxygenase [Sphingomonas baiyangensis]TKD50536.1 2OG-Fe(II) oxygenase [Sphingomonas baiyangensis]
MATKAKTPGTPSPLRRQIGESVTARLDAAPGVTRVDIEAAQVYYHLDFLTDEECETLIAVIDKGRRPSTLLSQSSDPSFRTSESCDMTRGSPIIEPIERRVCELMGIDMPRGETMQGQRYAPGQQFRAHHDYFHESEPYWPAMQREGGQRTWTAMAYLNDVEEGGATWFPKVGIRIPPRKRMLLIWNNMAADGSPNPDTLHEGMAVVRGTKYIFTKWFRENPWGRFVKG